MNFFRRFSSAIAVVVFGALIYLAVYAYKEGFTKKWRKLITKEFLAHDLHIQFDKLTLDPIQGLVANDVILLERGSNQKVASISKARLDLNLTKSFRQEPLLERIELESATVTLPLDPEASPDGRFVVKNLNANVLLTNNRIEIARATADLYGLSLELTGALLRPDAGASDAPVFDWKAGKLQAAKPILRALIDQLEKMEFSQKSPPLLALAVSGDLADPASLKLEGHLRGEEIHYKTFLCESLNAKAHVTSKAFTLDSLTLWDPQGRMDVSGDFPFHSDTPAQLAVDSSIHLGALLPVLLPDLPLWSWLKLSIPPIVRFEGSLQLDQPFSWEDPPIDFVGHMGAEGLRLGNEFFQHLSGDFHLQGRRVFLRNVSLRHHQGISTGKWLFTPEEGIRYEAQLGFDPHLLDALPAAKALQPFLDQWAFSDDSEVRVELAGKRKGNDPSTWDHRGKAALNNCRYRGAGIDRLAAEFQLNPHAYHFSNIDVQLLPDPPRDYPGGSLTAQRVSVSAREGVTMLTDLEGYVHPGQVVRCFHPPTADALDRFRFDRPPEVRIPRGTLDPAGTTQTNLQVEVKAAGTMTTTLFDEALPLEQPRFGLRFHRENLIVRADHAVLFGGSLVGNLDLRNLYSTRDYTAKMDLTAVDFGALGALYFPEHESDGQLTGRFAWSGVDDDLKSITGEGSLHLLNSERIQVPVLGPLSALTEWVRGKTSLSHPVVKDLGLAFSMEDASIDLKAIVGDLGAYGLRGQGTVDLISEAVDLTVSLITTRPVTAPLEVLYEVFGSYRCSGTLDKPRWELVQRFEAADLLRMAESLGDFTKKLPLDPKARARLDPTGILNDLLNPGDTEGFPEESDETRSDVPKP